MFISVSRRLTSRSSTILLGGCYERCLATAAGSTDHKAYSATLLLPKTTLPLKHKNAVAAELVYRSRTTEELYRKQWASNNGPLFVLHDGPPYANGHLHMGHALNKILKDIITRYNVIRGRKVHYLPGWDCHGLPIEQKALKAIGKSHTAMSPSAVRETARTTAAEAIEMQKEEFRSLAVMADWDNPEGVYITMNAGFEHRQMLLFQKMVEQGHITYRLRPTYYSPSSRTALAESELKYEDGHQSRSVYVGFAVDEADMSCSLRKAYEEAVAKTEKAPLRLAVWTTTAWTLPANAGVNVGEKMEYSIVKTTDNQLLVVAEARREALSEKLGPLETLAQLSGADLSGTRYTHPFHPPSDSAPRPVVFPSSHVTDQSGTGLVHSAPAHGHEDYIAFSKAGLLPKELRCPVDDDGCFTAEVVDWAGSEDARDLVSKSVLGDGVGAMVDLLRRQNALLAEETIEHRYPHDWKTKEPIIVRATPQWFADVEAVKPRALTSLEKVNFYPPQSRNRLEAFVTSRSEWCISRQRSWGVPIPALYDEAGRPVVDKATVSRIIKVLGEKGTDYWWTGPVEEFVPEHLQGQALHKGTDTLDVWFDSGSSWTMLDAIRSEEPLAEVYLEGSDQHRGWFQSSLLTKLSTSHTDTQAPYGNIISHGMVMDEDGQKMSKSAGNGLSPVDVTMGTKEKPGQGADTLRVWAASVDYTRDVSIGPNAIKHASESLRKIRSAMRFLLANTSGETARALSEVELGPLELYILHELSQLEAQAIASYDVFAFNKVLNSITTFLSSTLSSFYFDTVKETLYCEAAENSKRLAIVAVLQQASNIIRKIIAPIAPHLAEELHEHAGGKDSVFLDTWQQSEDRRDMALGEDMRGILYLRSAVNQLGEDLRAKGHIKNVDETTLVIFAEAEALRVLERFHDDLPSIFGISTVNLGDDTTAALADSEVALATLGKVRITLSKSTKSKCARCWKHRAEGEELCTRCAVVTRP